MSFRQFYVYSINSLKTLSKKIPNKTAGDFFWNLIYVIVLMKNVL